MDTQTQQAAQPAQPITPAQAKQTAFEKITGIKTAPVADSPAPEAEGQAVEVVEEQPALDVEAPESEQLEAAPETEEVEFDDFKFSLPKTHAQKVKDALMRTADYTQKTQATAERERAIAAREAAFQAQAQFHQTALEDISVIRGLDQQLAQFQNVNWSQLGTEDLMRTKLYHDQLKEQRNTALQALQQRQNQFTAHMAEQLKQIETSSYQEVTLKIPGFNDKAKKDVIQYAVESGYTEAEAARMFLNPRDVQIVWKAKQFDALQASKPSIQNRANGAPPVVKPGPAKQAVSKDTQLKQAFQREKDPARKLALGRELLGKKLGV